MAMVMLQSRRYGRISAAVVRRLRFPTIVTQGPSTKEELRRIGVEALDLPSGVDLERFRPPTNSERASAKTALGLSTNDAVVLHVGHIKEDRNILLLERVRRELGCSVVLVGSTSTEQDESLLRRLESNQIMVISHYLEDISSLYRAADCYLFPVHVTGNAIEMPLSVLEALACGTPVVTTPFGSLPDWLDPGPAVTYAADDDSLIAATREILQSDSLPVEQVRQAALPFSWSSVGDQLMTLIGVDAVRKNSRLETQLVSA
jgi:glycosyltransferase involved in cell wall biosynthesis